VRPSNETANDSGASTSPWMGVEVPRFDGPLPSRLSAEICVVGAGIAGLSIAHALMREGRRVAVLDDGPIGGGETGRTTSHLTAALDVRIAEVESIHGVEGARRALASHVAAIDRIEATCREEGIRCDFARVDGYLFGPTRGVRELDRERAAAERAGLQGLELMTRAPLPGFDTGPALRFPRQAMMHPLLYLRGLAEACARGGVRIHTGVRVSTMEDGPPPKITTADGRVIEADAIVDATNGTISAPVALPLRQAGYMTYVIGLMVPVGSVPAGLFWDMEDPFHYVRLRALSEPGPEAMVLVGGADHKAGQDRQPEHRYAELEAWARARFPSAGIVAARWSGEIRNTFDGLAFIGRVPGKRNLYVSTGDSGNGMTYGTIAGIVLSDILMGRHDEWAELYEPSRKTLRALGEFVRENANTAKQYADWLRPCVHSADAIPAGSGALVRHGPRLLAVYRDPAGTVHERSAMCPHLGGVVAWNEAEKTWDCPCHGSRFDAMGRVIAGPAKTDLELPEGGKRHRAA
jgi:glycine/D-amino acid oxidase-like deaminating enzyme/nitrite reductase/ring-hydroxylating ferredoxin subunit